MTRQLAKIICDSVSPCGVRLTTMEVVFPRIVLAEFNTHRVLSRNSASSRAIPVQKMIKAVVEDPYIPERWGLNGKGMQDHGEIGTSEAVAAERTWLRARDQAVSAAKELLEIGVHKQTTNRLLEPFMWHTAICTATEWSNFFHLRNHPDAHPALQRTAAAMQRAYETHVPDQKKTGDWHLPFCTPETIPDIAEYTNYALAGVASARCARVSYLTHDGRIDTEADFDLHDRLTEGGHMSPLEHAAVVVDNELEYVPSNFRHPWLQYRKTIPNESDPLG